MATFVYNSYKGLLFSGAINAATVPLYVSLVTSSYSPSVSHRAYADFSGAEVAQSATYDTRGKIVSSPTISIDSTGNSAALRSSSNVTWASSTITASGAVLYASGTIAGIASPLIAFFDFGQNQTSNNGDFVLEWSSNGILKIQNG